MLTRTREDQGNQALDPGESPAERVLREERAVAVYEALETLPPDYRSILVLREMEGCRYERIAEILQLPLGTVRSRLHRARVQLSEQLKDVRQASPAEP